MGDPATAIRARERGLPSLSRSDAGRPHQGVLTVGVPLRSLSSHAVTPADAELVQGAAPPFDTVGASSAVASSWRGKWAQREAERRATFRERCDRFAAQATANFEVVDPSTTLGRGR
jgi:hypothetical protein